MKISITGHTSGLGECLYKHLSQNNTVLGFSRSSGFSIAEPQVREHIASGNYDVFINNAFNFDNMDNDDQLSMLKLVYEKHYGDMNTSSQWSIAPINENTKPLIINIGSSITDAEPLRSDVQTYKARKVDQQVYMHGRDIVDIRPPLMSTRATHFTGKNSNLICGIVDFAIEQYFEHCVLHRIIAFK